MHERETDRQTDHRNGNIDRNKRNRFSAMSPKNSKGVDVAELLLRRGDEEQALHNRNEIYVSFPQRPVCKGMPM